MEFGAKKISFLIFSIVFLSQQTFAYACPNFTFSTDLKFSDRNTDVKAMQEILNLDKRTVVAQSGPGSFGNETNFFGIATRESLKRFQALFIEYVGVADGKFNSRTRTTMNAVCKGSYFTKNSGAVYDIGSETGKDTLAPVVAIAGPTNGKVGEPFRAFLASNEAIEMPSLSSLLIAYGTASDLRKVSSTTYSFLVTPASDASGNITLQFEADSIADLAGNKNDKATNEWIVVLDLLGAQVGVDLPTIDIPTIDIPVVTPTTDCSTVKSVDINDYNNPCYGQAPMDYQDSLSEEAGGGGGGGGMQDMLTKLLEGLMKGLGSLGGAGGGGSQGGTGTVKAGCACAKGKTTVLLTPKGGVGRAGYYIDTINPGPGEYVGTPAMGPQYCGFRIEDGNCKGQFLNVLGQPVIGIIPPPPAFMWNR